MGILWSSVIRNETILVEASENESKGQSVIQIAQHLLQKEATQGWEYYRNRMVSKLRGVKFHVYDDQTTDNEPLLVWSFCAVYDPRVLELVQVKSFLEKMVYLTDHFREYDSDWRLGGILAAQASFAPILYQRMQEVTYMGKVAMLSEEVDQCKEIMSNNIEMVLERDENLEAMLEDATHLQELSRVFKKRTKKLKRFKMLQNAKHGILIGTAVTGAIAVITIPPLIALL